jgi:DNA invertase Pin-like site-specific DNA recombinase
LFNCSTTSEFWTKISERTVAGLERARKQGRVGGRPKLVLDRDQVRRLPEEGKSLREISDTMGSLRRRRGS